MKQMGVGCVMAVLLAALLSGCGGSTWELLPAAATPAVVASAAPEAVPSVRPTPEPTAPPDRWEALLTELPPYDGEPYVVLCDNVPGFEEEDWTTASFECYSELDELGRCGPAWANVGRDLMPTGARGDISQIQPSGWHTVQYDCVDGGYLYHRCHLLGYQLTGENANRRNLITGTRYLNLEGMLPFENLVADYVQETGGHVLYRVTPVFRGEELVARGVVLEGYSVEDGGAGITFCVYAYNVQPGVVIDYATGESRGEGAPEPTRGTETEAEYVLNTNTRKFHYPSCSSVAQMSEKNKQYFTGTREEVLAGGYEPCKRCCP